MPGFLIKQTSSWREFVLRVAKGIDKVHKIPCEMKGESVELIYN